MVLIQLSKIRLTFHWCVALLPALSIKGWDLCYGPLWVNFRLLEDTPTGLFFVGSLLAKTSWCMGYCGMVSLLMLNRRCQNSECFLWLSNAVALVIGTFWWANIVMLTDGSPWDIMLYYILEK